MAQSGGLLRLPRNCSSWGCRIRSLILCSSHGVTKGFVRLKNSCSDNHLLCWELQLQFNCGGCGVSRPQPLSLSNLCQPQHTYVSGSTPVLPIWEKSNKDPLQVGAMCRCSWAGELLKQKILQLCCHSNWVTQPDRLSLGLSCACWIHAYTSWFKRVFIMLINYF